jgi:tripartite-type tricarboxylate transporter receptor subunit TctC
VCVKVAIDRFIAETNADPKPFVWIAPPSRILAAVKQGIARVANVMVVHPSFPAKTVPEFIAYVKANPRKVTMASAGVGSTSHMAGELFKMMAGVNMVHVPYRGQAAALTDLLGGQVLVDFATMPPSIGFPSRSTEKS